jgi:hypothetical protein
LRRGAARRRPSEARDGVVVFPLWKNSLSEELDEQQDVGEGNGVCVEFFIGRINVVVFWPGVLVRPGTEDEITQLFERLCDLFDRTGVIRHGEPQP